ncbi:MAG: hypothetical protein KDA37_15600 [Planctomycetales bacterium]|nr:hypothetical protein [Planctomycetales bacterium]
MSQFGVVAITDRQTLANICQGWSPAATEPRKISINNPFTGELIETTSYKPAALADEQDCASLEEVGKRLREAKPVAFDFQSASFYRGQFLDAATPVLFGNTEEGPISVDLVPPKVEDKVVEYFGELMGEYADAEKRRAEGLSMFVLIDSF